LGGPVFVLGVCPMASEFRFNGSEASLRKLVDKLNLRERREVYRILPTEHGATYIQFGRGGMARHDPAKQTARFGEILTGDAGGGGLIVEVVYDGEPDASTAQLWEQLRETAQRYGWLDTPPAKDAPPEAPSSVEESASPSPPTTQAQKGAAYDEWRGLPKQDRPRLESWLGAKFGFDLATGCLQVPVQTFYSWKKYSRNGKPKSS
jgi:hypothetical protein